MRQIWLAMLVMLLAATTAAAQSAPPAQAPQAQAQAQVQAQDQTQLMGRGRGGAPFAWNDRNRAGICDLTGQAVGQRPIGFGRGRGWRGMADPTGAAPLGPVGQGRGGAPLAWNDRNGDGICDVTGQAIGRGFAAGAGAGAGRGRGAGRGAGWRR